MTQKLTVYISSGAKNAMYTLRVMRAGEGFFLDNYICNLSTTSETAETKARDYFDRVSQGHPDWIFQGFADFDLSAWGAPSPWERAGLQLVAQDLFPFGKNKGASILDADDGYLLWWAEQVIGSDTNKPAAALIDRCKGIALDRNLYAKREAKNEAREAAWQAKVATSRHIGTLDTRQRFTATITRQHLYENDFGDGCITTMEDADGQVLVYFGWSLTGDVGDVVSFDARIKRHSDYKGLAQTIVNRPTKIETAQAQAA
jgi:hypothetical protein